MNVYTYSDIFGKPSIQTNLYLYSAADPVNLVDPLGLKEFDLTIWTGGSVGYYVVGGGVYNVEIWDTETGASTLYTMKVIGLGVGLPSFRASSKDIRFSVPDSCATSDSFDGLGYMGGISLEASAGLKIGGGIKIPNGPFIPGKILWPGWDRGGFDVGVSHSLTYWTH